MSCHSQQTSNQSQTSSTSEMIFSINIGKQNEWAQNMVAAAMGPLAATLQEIMQKERDAQVEFTKSTGEFEQSAASFMRQSGTVAAVESGIIGVATIGTGAATAYLGGVEVGKTVGFANEGAELTEEAKGLDAQEKSLETGHAFKKPELTDAEKTKIEEENSDSTPEDLQAKIEAKQKEKEEEAFQKHTAEQSSKKADIRRRKEENQRKREDLGHRRSDSRAAFENTSRMAQLAQTGAELVKTITQPAKADKDANAGLQKAYSSIATTGEKTMDNAYSGNEQVFNGALQATGGVYSSSRAAAGG